MDYNLTDIKDLVAIAKPIVEPLISTFIKPKIEQLTFWLKGRELENKIINNFFENKFEEYLARTYDNCKNINILIFQNQQIKIDDIYLPLSLRSAKDKSTYKINNFDLKILEPYKKILISDTAGMGKSTIMKWVCLKIIESSIAIPILIELRNLKDNHSILDEIYNQINPIDKNFDKDIILKFLDLGNFVVLFDGFDEIQLKNQESIIKDLREFVNKASNNYFILTSRPEGALASFGDFQLFNILPLKKNESFELIKKYDSICPVKIGDKLISDIEKNFNQTQELLENPFLVSLIYSTYTYNKDIPSNKVTFYEEIYSALFKRHDLSKDGWTRLKKSKLDIQQFKIVTRQLAFDTAVLGEVAYNESEILNHIKIAKEKCPGFEFNVADFFDDLLSAVPLFQRDGSKIKWAHKSLQDYFAADFIAFSSRKEEILERLYMSERDGFLNILDLFYELDYKTFRNIIIRNLLEKYVDFHNSSYQNIKEVSEIILNERKSHTFEKTLVISTMSEVNGVNDAFDNAQKLEHFKDKSIRSAMLIQNDLVIISSYTFKRQLLELILEKQPIYQLTITSKKRRQKFNLEKGEDMVPIDDNPKSTVNNIKNFSKINYFLREDFFSPEKGNYVINYNVVKTELDKMLKEIAKEKIIDNFNDI